MSILEKQISATLLSGMHIPKELSLLFSWIEGNQYYIDRGGSRVGFLCPLEKLREEWGEEERQGGTVVEFFAQGNLNMHYWLGHNKPDVINRLCVFAKTGADGSMAAFWLDENGKQKIVHMGSGSGSTLVCVLSEQPIDFLRLLAIGYDEICWNDYFNETPNESAEDAGIFVHPNIGYQNWVKSTFKVAIPEKANEIILHPSEMGDTNSQDEFCRWIEANA